MSKWAPDCTPCTPAWWLDTGCFGAPNCPPCSWTVPPCLPEPTAPMNPYYPFAPYAPPYPQYGFNQCDCGPPPTPWAPYQMPTQYPTPPLYRRPCPQYVGHGACCDECASGKGCAGSEACCAECAAGAPCSCAAQTPQAAVLSGYDRSMQAQAQVGAIYVSDAELDALGSQVAILDGEVRAAAQKEYLSSDLAKQKADCLAAGFQWDDLNNRCKNLPDWLPGTPTINQPISGPLTKFAAEEWGPFDAKWNSYRGETFHAPTSYDVLRTEFISLLTKWKGQLGQASEAEPPDPLSENSGANAIPWGWIILGGAIVAIPFLLPAVAGTYLALTRGRSFGL